MDLSKSSTERSLRECRQGPRQANRARQESKYPFRRRDFLKASAGGALLATVASQTAAAESIATPETGEGQQPTFEIVSTNKPDISSAQPGEEVEIKVRLKLITPDTDWNPFTLVGESGLHHLDGTITAYNHEGDIVERTVGNSLEITPDGEIHEVAVHVRGQVPSLRAERPNSLLTLKQVRDDGETTTIKEWKTSYISLEATTARAEGVAPGGVEKVTLAATNTGSESLLHFSLGLDQNSLPDGWAINAAFGPQEEWDEATATWPRISLFADEVATRSLTIDVPDTASAGETVTLTAVARTDEAEVTTEVPISLVDRFDQTVHGFGFTNWGGDAVWPGHNHNWIARTDVNQFMEETFIPNLEDADIPVPDSVSPVLTALLYAFLKPQAVTDGHCYGMVFAAQEYFRDSDVIPVPDADTAGDITSPAANGDAVGGDIDFYQTTQALDIDTILAMFTLDHKALIDYGAILDEVRSTLADGKVLPLGLSSADGEAKHQVLAYGMKEGDGEVEIYVYDPRSPALNTIDGNFDLTAGFDPWGSLDEMEESNGEIPASYRPRDRSLVFDTSGETVSFPANRGYISTSSSSTKYERAVPLRGGGEIDQPVLAFGLWLDKAITDFLLDLLSGLVTFTINLVPGEDSNAALATIDGQSARNDNTFLDQTEASLNRFSDDSAGQTLQDEQSSPDVTVEVTGPNGERISQLTAETGIDTSGLPYDDFWYATGASAGEYTVSIDAPKEVKYTVNARGELVDGGSIDDEITATAREGETQTLSATLPERDDQTGQFQIDASTLNNDDNTIGADDDFPVFGVGGALAVLSGAAYLIKKRLVDEEMSSE